MKAVMFSLFLTTSNLYAADMPVSPQGGFKPAPVSPFASSRELIAFHVVPTRNASSEFKSYQSQAPALVQYMTDRRMPAPYYGKPVRAYTNWSFNAVRTVDDQGRDRSTVYMSMSMKNYFNPINPQDGVVMSNNGRLVRLYAGNNLVFEINDASNLTPGTGAWHCNEEGVLVERAFDIPNAAFEAFDSVFVTATPELVFGCR